MTKIDIFSGFLGAGKTTLIKKLIGEAFTGEKIVLIENEFGDIGIDGGFLKESGIQINEMNSGCICCTLVGDFSKAIEDVINKFSPDRILIEPSGVGKLSDVILAVENLKDERIILNSFTTIVDAKKCKMYMHNFGEFFNNQIENGNCIILSHTADMQPEALDKTVKLIRNLNDKASIVTTSWEELSGQQIIEAMEKKYTLEDETKALEKEVHEVHCEHGHKHDHEHEHNHEHNEEACGCCGGHNHGHHEHEHHNHKHHEHEHHDHGDDCGCCCGGHDHDHEGHHHADEIFDSIGIETNNKYTISELEAILDELDDCKAYGQILRAKGIVSSDEWIHFDYVPGEVDVRRGAAGIIGQIVVIGTDLNKDAIKALFKLN